MITARINSARHITQSCGRRRDVYEQERTVWNNDQKHRFLRTWITHDKSIKKCRITCHQWKWSFLATSRKIRIIKIADWRNNAPSWGRKNSVRRYVEKTTDRVREWKTEARSEQPGRSRMCQPKDWGKGLLKPCLNGKRSVAVSRCSPD